MSGNWQTLAIARAHEAMATFDKLSNIQHTILRRTRAREALAVLTAQQLDSALTVFTEQQQLPRDLF